MATILISGSTVITPSVVTAIDTERVSGNRVHDIIGRANPDVTLRPAGTRSGTLSIVFVGATSEADSAEAETALAAAAIWTLSSDDRASLEMSFVTSGRIARTLDARTGTWTLEVEFREVEAS